MRERSWDDFKDVLSKYKMIRPKDAQTTLIMGGVFVLDGNKVRARGDCPGARLWSTSQAWSSRGGWAARLRHRPTRSALSV